MGYAARARGTFEQRKAKAIARNEDNRKNNDDEKTKRQAERLNMPLDLFVMLCSMGVRLR